MNRLFWKIYLPVAICLVLTIVLSGYIAFSVIPSAVRDYQRRTLENFRALLLAQEQPLDLERAESLADSLGVQAEFISRPRPAHPPDGQQPVPGPGSVFLPGMPRDFPFIVEVSLMPGPREVRRQRIYFLWILILLLLEGTVLYLALRPLRKRMSRLERATSDFGAGRLGTRVDSSSGGGDLIDSLGLSFNAMADRIEHLVSSQRELLSSVAHELRTPLARLGLALEMARESASQDSRREKLIRMEKDLAVLDRLVSELLEYNRLGQEDYRPDSLETVDLALLTREVVDTESWGREGLDISLSGSASVRGHRRLLARAIGNLVRNACAYAESRVDVSLERSGHTASVVVSDDGPGIPGSIRDRIGQPFLRSEDSSSSGGSGLGLAIVFRIATIHHGELSTHVSHLGGAEARLTIPVEPG